MEERRELAAEAEALRRLSDNFGSLLPSPRFADARIAVGARELPVHRCVLAARSPFLGRELERQAASGGGERIEVGELLLGRAVGYEAVGFVLGYMYSGRVGPLPRGACECADEECGHVVCRPALDFLADVLYAADVFEIPELFNVFHRHVFDILKKVAIDDILVILSVAELCHEACTRLFTECIQIVAKSDLDVVTIEKAVPPFVVKQIEELRLDLGLSEQKRTALPAKHAEKIYRALDSDDIELVKMLLEEGQCTLDDADGLHYAVAYCDLKIVRTVLDIGLGDVNHKNLRGYSVLHIASMRKEPTIIMALLKKGARVSEPAPDGRRALQISKRLTRSADYETVQSLSANLLCIEILEQVERKAPLVAEDTISLTMDVRYLQEKLRNLQFRVFLATCIFPKEAMLAMGIAETDGSLEVSICGELHGTPEEQLSKMNALLKTVKHGRYYFPRCSEFLDNLVNDDFSMPDSSEEQKRRYKEIQEEVSNVFNADKKESNESALPSVSCSPPLRRVRRKIAKN